MPDESGRHTFDSLSRDLEVGVQDRSFRVFAGVRPATGQSPVYPDKGYALAEALDKVDNLADGVDFLLGRNLIDFDLPYLQAANSDLRLLRRPTVDGRDTVLFCAWRAWSCYRVVLPAWGKKLPMLIDKAVPSAHAAGLPLPCRELVAASHCYGVTVATCLPTDPETKGDSEATVRVAKATGCPRRPTYWRNTATAVRWRRPAGPSARRSGTRP